MARSWFAQLGMVIVVVFAISGICLAVDECVPEKKAEKETNYRPSPQIDKAALHGGPSIEPIPPSKWPSKKTQPDNSVWFIYNECKPIDGVEGLIPRWGTVYLFKWEGKRILFNVGNDPDVLVNNAGVLGADLSGIDDVVLDHRHFEHWEALEPVLKASPKTRVWCPPDLKKDVLKRWPHAKDNLRFVGKSRVEWLTPNFMVYHDHSGPKFGGPKGVDEYHIALRTKKGLIVGMGCAHSGVAEGIESALKKSGQKDVYLASGGFCITEPKTVCVKRIGFENGYWIPSRTFSLRGKEEYVNDLVKQVKAMGVQKIMAWMCTGYYAETMFRKAYKENFLNQRLGLLMRLPEPVSSKKEAGGGK